MSLTVSVALYRLENRHEIHLAPEFFLLLGLHDFDFNLCSYSRESSKDFRVKNVNGTFFSLPTDVEILMQMINILFFYHVFLLAFCCSLNAV